MFGLLKWLLIGSGAAYFEHTVSGGDDDDCQLRKINKK